jgi:hypothetical protein
MAANKIEKALYGPSLVEVILGAILGLLAGVAVACVYLVFKPVLTVREMPKEPVRNAVYFLPGAESNAKSKSWQVKQKQFLAGTRVQLVEDELNAWATTIKLPTAAAPAAPAKPAKPAKPGEKAEKPSAPAPDGFVIPAKPNFRIANGKMQIGLQCTLNWYGIMTDVTVQATGDLQKEGDVFAFVPETVYLGSCPLHLLPMLPGLLISHITANEPVPDDFKAAWAKLSEAKIEGSTLKLAGQ